MISMENIFLYQTSFSIKQMHIHLDFKIPTGVLDRCLFDPQDYSLEPSFLVIVSYIKSGQIPVSISWTLHQKH